MMWHLATPADFSTCVEEILLVMPARISLESCWILAASAIYKMYVVLYVMAINQPSC